MNKEPGEPRGLEKTEYDIKKAFKEKGDERYRLATEELNKDGLSKEDRIKIQERLDKELKEIDQECEREIENFIKA